MAKLFYAVFEEATTTFHGPLLNEGFVTIGGTSAKSSVANSTQAVAVMDTNGGNKVRTVRLFPEADCFATWAGDATALDTGLGGRPMQAGQAEAFDIPADHELAVISRAVT